MATKHKPHGTKLFNLPVLVDNKLFNLNIYMNYIDSITNDNPALMIVPYPKGKIGFLDMTNDKSKQFVKDIVNITEIKYQSFGKYTERSSNNSLEVYEVGNYNISVANSIKELNDKLNWNRFQKPYDLETRLSVLNDKNIYFQGIEYCYVVAQATKNIKEDGFGILYEYNGETYFPTAHEQQILSKRDSIRSSSNDYKHVDYDVKCYNFMVNNKINNISQLVLNANIDEYENDYYINKINNICKLLDNSEVIFSDKIYNMNIIKVNKLVVYNIKGSNKNMNLIIKYNTTEQKIKYNTTEQIVNEPAQIILKYEKQNNSKNPTTIINYISDLFKY